MDLSCQSKKLVGERHCHCAIRCELAFAGHPPEFDAEEIAGGERSDLMLNIGLLSCLMARE